MLSIPVPIEQRYPILFLESDTKRYNDTQKNKKPDLSAKKPEKPDEIKETNLKKVEDVNSKKKKSWSFQGTRIIKRSKKRSKKTKERRT